MATSPEAEAAFKAGDTAAALAAIKASIRKAPADPDLRLFLFQILAVRGDWDAAQSQMDSLGELTGRQSPMPLVYSAVLKGEISRRDVFAGQITPTVLGEPPPWIAHQVQAVQHAARGEWAAAAACQDQVREIADGVPGSADGDKPFEWIMDADSRTELVIEAIIRDTYYWIPQSRLLSLTISPPETLRDLIWARAEATFTNGGSTALFLPVRYPLNNLTPDVCRLSRETAWAEPAPGFLTGAGVRIWTTSAENDLPLLSTTSLVFDNPAEGAPPLYAGESEIPPDEDAAA